MTQYDIIKLNSSLFAFLLSAKVSLADVQYLGMYEKYKAMLKEGNKKEYIYGCLAWEYKCTTRNVKKILWRMSKEITI